MLLALGRSLMYNKKRMGPNIEPCGTPHLIFCNEDEQLFFDTY